MKVQGFKGKTTASGTILQLPPIQTTSVCLQLFLTGVTTETPPTLSHVTLIT